MQQHPITATFGTIVEGVTPGSLAPPVFRRLYELWLQRHVLVLRGPPGAAAAFADFVAGFGEAEAMRPAHTGWDAELSWAERPPFACAMAPTSPRAAGSTSWFACLPAALRLMAPDLVARLRWLALQHGRNVHPMVIMQPETGEPSLYLGARGNTHIPGLPAAESDRLLNIAWSYATSAPVTLCHAWQPGDVVVWNNLTVAHRHEFAPGGSDAFQGLRVKGRYTLSAPIQQEAA